MTDHLLDGSLTSRRVFNATFLLMFVCPQGGGVYPSMHLGRGCVERGVCGRQGCGGGGQGGCVDGGRPLNQAVCILMESTLVIQYVLIL